MHDKKAYGQMEVQLHPLLISVLDVGKRSVSRNILFIPREKLLMHTDWEAPWAPGGPGHSERKKNIFYPAENETTIPQFSSPCLFITTNVLFRQRFTD